MQEVIFMNMVWYYVPAIIWVIFGVGILAAQCFRSARVKSRGQINWVTMEPVMEDPAPIQKEEGYAGLEEWIAAELEKDFMEPEVPLPEPETPKRMVLNDINTGRQTDLSIDALWGEGGEEVSDIHQAVSMAGRDNTGRWWAVDLKEFSWECPTVH